MEIEITTVHNEKLWAYVLSWTFDGKHPWLVYTPHGLMQRNPDGLFYRC